MWTKHAAVVGAGLVVISGALTVVANAEGGSGGNKPMAPRPTGVAMAPDPSAEYGTPNPDVCGAWSRADGALAQRFAQFGPILNCLKLQDSWIITTEGTTSSTGAVLVARCRDAACGDGRNDQTGQSWRAVKAQHAGVVKVVQVVDTHVRLTIGQAQGDFDSQSQTLAEDQQ